MNTSVVLRIAAAAALALSLAACGAGTQLAPQNGTVVPGSKASTGQPVTGSISIHLPSAVTPAASVRRPAYVAPQSTSATLTIAPSAGCTQCSSAVTQNVALAAPVCNAGTCTIPFSLVSGTYTGSLIFYDGALSPAGLPTGNPLSEKTSFPMTIVSGQPNVVGVVLDGVPVSIVETNATPATMYLTTRVINGTPQAIYRISTTATTGQITLAAKDADGNVIAGPGAPTWSASNGGNASYTVGVNGNVLSVTTPALRSLPAALLTVNAVSSACSDPTAKCSVTTAVGMQQLLAVSDSAGGHIEVWPIGAIAPVAIIASGLTFPVSMAFGSDGTLFVANSGGNTVTIYPPPYTTTTPQTITTGVTNPESIAVDSTNNVYVSNAGFNVTVYGPPYGNPTVTIPTGSGPLGIALDASRNVWIGRANNSLVRYPVAGGAFDHVISGVSTDISDPVAVAVDASGNLYVASSMNNTVERFSPPYTSGPPAVLIQSTPTEVLTSPNAIAVGPAGQILVANGNGVNAYSANGTGVGNVGAGVFGVLGVVADADGTVWAGAHGIGQQPVGVPPPYDGTNLLNLEAPGSAYTFLNTTGLAIY